MTRYFILQKPASELLMGDGNASYRNRITSPCPVSNDHHDLSRRVGSLSLEVAHNRRDELMIWWFQGLVVHKDLVSRLEHEGFTGYRIAPATVRFHDGYVSADYREL